MCAHTAVSPSSSRSVGAERTSSGWLVFRDRRTSAQTGEQPVAMRRLRGKGHPQPACLCALAICKRPCSAMSEVERAAQAAGGRPATPTVHAATCPIFQNPGTHRDRCTCGHGRNRWTADEEKRANDLMEAGNDYDAIASALNRDVHGGAEIRNANAVRNKIYRPKRPRHTPSENTGTNAGSSSDAGGHDRRGLALQPPPPPPLPPQARW